jgi:hypothetical protein
MVNLEALSLQGLPIDRFLLTSETRRDIQGLSGNAVTSTVIGAAMLASLMATSLLRRVQVILSS